MKKITAWNLNIKSGYREVDFEFATAVEAQEFLILWLNHKTGTDEYNDKEDRFCIRPVFEPDETEDDITVK